MPDLGETLHLEGCDLPGDHLGPCPTPDSELWTTAAEHRSKTAKVRESQFPQPNMVEIGSGKPYPLEPRKNASGYLAFMDYVRAVLNDHWSGLPEHRPSEQVWARLDAVLFDAEGISRVEPDFEEALREQ